MFPTCLGILHFNNTWHQRKRSLETINIRRNLNHSHIVNCIPEITIIKYHFKRKYILWRKRVSDVFVSSNKLCSSLNMFPDSKVHGANMGPIWGPQDPGGPHVGLMNLAIWVDTQRIILIVWCSGIHAEYGKHLGILTSDGLWQERLQTQPGLVAIIEETHEETKIWGTWTK